MIARLIEMIPGALRKRLDHFGWDAMIILFARILQNANGFALSVIIVRKFGLAAAGSLTIATIPTVVLGTLCTFGLPYIFAREQADNTVRNSIGLAAWVLAILLALPVNALLGWLTGQDVAEATTIFLLSMAGPFFAQTNIANALLVLQGRVAVIVLAPLGNLVGLILGFFYADTPVEFALILAGFRLAGTLAIFLILPLARVDLAACAGWIRRGLRFLTADVINLGADQAAVMIASYLLTRSDLGVYGLCRQMLTLSDTPGWSRLIAWYPRVYADPHKTIPALTRQMVLLGIFCAICAAAVSVLLGLWVYHLPSFMILAPVLLCSVPFRYLVGVYDMSLRAIGAVGATNKVTAIRCVLVLFLCGFLIELAGIKGAIAATILLAIISAWLTRVTLHRSLATAPNNEKTARDIGRPDQAIAEIPS